MASRETGARSHSDSDGHATHAERIVKNDQQGSIPPSMNEIELDQLRRHPTWRAALRYYWERQTQARESQENFDGWVPRAAEVPHVDAPVLSTVHGRLIAFGFLKFDLSNRDLGMRYQLTPLGRQAIGAEPTEIDAEPLAESA